MARFEKTRIHPASAVLFLLGLYAITGGIHAAFTHSADSVMIWTIVAVLSFVAALFYQRRVTRKRARRNHREQRADRGPRDDA